MKQPKPSPLTSKRKKIDAIDSRLLKLLNQRASIVNKIKLIKEKQAIHIYDPQREAQILKRLSSENKGPLSNSEVKKLFSKILQLFRSRQRSMRKGRQNKR